MLCSLLQTKANLATWVDLPVSCHAVGIYDTLKHRREFVSSIVGWRGLLGDHTIEDGWHAAAASLLQTKS